MASSNAWKQFLGVALTSLLTLTWFRFKPIYYGDMGLGTTLDNTPTTYIAALFKASLSGLSPSVYPGTRGVQIAPLYAFTVNLAHTFTPLWFSQFAYVYALALIAGLGVCALLGRVCREQPPWWAGVFAGAFYFYGPNYQFFVGDGAYAQLGFYASYPLMVYACLGLTALGQAETQRYLKDLLTLLAAFFVGSAGFAYYYYITGLASLLLVSLIYLAARARGLKGSALGLGGLVLGLLIAQLSVAPIVAIDLQAGPTLAQSNTTSPNLLTLFLRRTQQTTYVYELTQDFWHAPGPFTQPNPDVPGILTSPIIGALFLALLVTTLFGVGKKSLKQRLGEAAPFLAAYLLVLPLAAGPEPPFGPIVVHAFESAWFFRAITESFTSLNYISQLSLAALLGIALAAAPKGRGTSGRTTLYAAIALAVVAAALIAPYASGSPLPGNQLEAWPNGVAQSFYITPRVEIPQYFKELVEYANSLPPHGAVLLLPVGGNFRTTSWYIAVDALSSVLNKPVVGGGYVSTPQTKALIDLLVLWEQGANIDLWGLLDRTGVGYIVVEGDAATAPPYTAEPPFNITQIEARLNQTQGITPTKRFGPDTLYTVSWGDQPTWGGDPTYSYGFSAYTRVVEATPQPQAPYPVLYVPKTQDMDPKDSQCATSGGGITIDLSKGFAQCAFKANITSSSPLYVSLGYSAPPDSDVGAQLLDAWGRPTAGLTVVRGESGGQAYTVTAFPPGNYTGLQLYAGGKGGLGFRAQIEWAYVSGAATLQELVGYQAEQEVLYVSPESGGPPQPKVLLDSTGGPTAHSWSCTIYLCAVNLTATQPFFFVYYASYSDSYTLYVNGEPQKQHYLAYGAFNAWPIEQTGNLELKVVYRSPLTPYEALSLAAWALTLLAYLTSALKPKPRLANFIFGGLDIWWAWAARPAAAHTRTAVANSFVLERFKWLWAQMSVGAVPGVGVKPRRKGQANAWAGGRGRKHPECVRFFPGPEHLSPRGDRDPAVEGAGEVSGRGLRERGGGR